MKETRYFVVIESGSGHYRIGGTLSGGEDGGRAVGWSIADLGYQGASWTTNSLKSRIAVRGRNAPASAAPVVENAIPDRVATVGVEFEFAFDANTFRDPDRFDTLTWTATKGDGTDLPAWLAFDAATRTFSGTPAVTDVETLEVRVTADDRRGGTVTDTFNIVVGTNAVPTAADGEVETDEDVGYAFAAADFNFSDTDTGDALAGVKVVTLPGSGKGTLKLDGTAIPATELPKTVTRAELDDDKLVYDPPRDANGDDYTSFTFRVNDGDADSASAYTMTVDVDSVPDVTDVAVTSTPTSGTADPKDTYGVGEKIQVTVTFDEAVTVTGNPTLGVMVGTNTRVAAYGSGTGTTELVFEYTVVAEDMDDNGVSIAADALTRDSDDKIENSAEKAADLTFAAVAARATQKVDGSLTPPADIAPDLQQRRGRRRHAGHHHERGSGCGGEPGQFGLCREEDPGRRQRDHGEFDRNADHQRRDGDADLGRGRW